jgi:hypothetical protein
MESGNRAGQENDEAQTGDESGIADQDAKKRKEKVKCFFNGKGPIFHFYF